MMLFSEGGALSIVSATPEGGYSGFSLKNMMVQILSTVTITA